MLQIINPGRRMGRREMLTVGGLALGGMSFRGFQEAQAAAEKTRVATGKSVIFLFLHGGPPQTETFDPKMGAQQGVRSATGELQTRIPGVTFGTSFPQLAQRADKVSIVRSYVPGDANHDIKPIVCKDSAGSSLGALYSRVVGANHSLNGMPTNVTLFPRAVNPATQPGVMNFGRFDATGGLGAAYAPFIPGAGGNLQEDMQLRLTADRLGDRRELLAGLDKVRFALDASGRLEGLDRIREQAFSTILGGAATAFDLSKEDPRTIAKFDTEPLLGPNDINKKWNNYNNYMDNVRTLGKLMLLARRLCESGCGFVTVTTSFVWDFHADVNNAGVEEGMRYMGGPLDHALAAFIDDLEERGLSDKILLVVCGEIGRTPRINSNGGRDHWGGLGPLLLSGGGLKMGQVIGQSTRDVGEPLSEPMTIKHLLATIMHTLFDVAELRLVQGVPGEVMRAATAASPIPGLLG